MNGFDRQARRFLKPGRGEAAPRPYDDRLWWVDAMFACFIGFVDLALLAAVILELTGRS